jgi:hypothetical protein
MPPPGHTRVNRLGEGDVVSIGVGDHECLHLAFRRPLPRIDAELLELHCLIVEAAYSKRETYLAETLLSAAVSVPAGALAPLSFMTVARGWRF